MKQPRTPLDSLAALLRRAPRGAPLVGATPHTVVWAENKWRLLRFAPESPQFATPIVMVPSLINRWYVLDLGPQRSLIEWLVGRGHTVYCIDWGTPGPEDRYLTWDDIAGRYIGRAVRVAARASRTRDVHVFGYCLGGTLAATYVAAFPEHVASFLALATPIDFEHAGILATWTRTPTFDVRLLVEALGNVPWQLLQSSFQLLRPTLPMAKTIALLDRAWDDEFLEGFLATERWGTDNVAFPGACYTRYIDELYRQNRLVRGGFTLCDRPVDLGRIRCPVLAVGFEDDHIVPMPCAAPLVEMVASRHRQLVRQSGGHVGAVVSRKASERLWPVLSEFFALGP